MAERKVAQMGKKTDSAIKFDGLFYEVGEELPDLGSWVCTDAINMVRNYVGCSSDVDKLPHYVETDSTALCVDTSELYIFHKPTDTWYKL